MWSGAQGVLNPCTFDPRSDSPPILLIKKRALISKYWKSKVVRMVTTTSGFMLRCNHRSIYSEHSSRKWVAMPKRVQSVECIESSPQFVEMFEKLSWSNKMLMTAYLRRLKERDRQILARRRKLRKCAAIYRSP